jgi:Domain of unknown function (DUF4389)/zinc-ribbon domain
VQVRPARFCTRCGAARVDGARFCTRCGAWLDETVPRPLEPAALPPEEAAPVHYPVSLELAYRPQVSRLRTGLRLPLALPHVILWLLLFVVSLVTTTLAWITALITGRQSSGLRRLHTAMLRYATRTAAYAAIATDAPPAWPWRDDAGHPVSVEVPPDVRLRRMRTLLILPLSLPAVLTALMFGIVTFMLAIGAWFAVLATGRLPRTIHDMQMLAIGFQCRTLAHVPLLLMAKYPWYEREGVLLPSRR